MYLFVLPKCRIFSARLIPRLRQLQQRRSYANLNEILGHKPEKSPVSKTVEGWKLIYQDNPAPEGAFPKMYGPYYGTMILYLAILSVPIAYIYLKWYNKPRYQQFQSMHPVKLGIMAFQLQIPFTIMFIRRRLFVNEIFKNVKNPRQYYLTRYNWLLQKEKVLFKLSNVSVVSFLSPTNIVSQGLIEGLGRWKIKISGDKFRKMRLFDQRFTSGEDKLTFLKVNWG